MARRKEVGTFITAAMSAALIGGLALPAQAEEFALGGTALFTTDYISRGISNSGENPAVQASLEASYGIFYAGIWGSSLDFGGNGFGQNLASVEIDYYVGVTPEWGGVNFDFNVHYYTYPDAFDPGGNFDYAEFLTGASYTFGDAFTVGVSNYWRPDSFGETGDASAFGGSAEYAFSNQLFNFFAPSVSGLVGHQYYSAGGSYTYWNAGVSLGFMDNFSVDILYWDTDISGCTSGLFSCDSRVVGSLSASF